MAGRIVIITWVSASWKTTLQEELLRRGWMRPVNFTTRRPREREAYDIDADWDYISQELDEYVYTDRKTLLNKFANWDLLEVSQYWGNLYWVSKYFPKDKNVCIILDPSWREQVLSYYARLWKEVDTVFLDIGKEEQERRLLLRGDRSDEILVRRTDFKWFFPTPLCKRYSWLEDTKVLADKIDFDF